MKKKPVQFVGAGPGDPDLITIKGMKALQKANVVIYTGSLVPTALLKWAPAAECLTSANLNLKQIIDTIVKAVEQDKHVVRLHTGDPSLYGAIFEQIAALNKRGIPCTVIPGVTAAFAAAAGLALEYTLPEIAQTLILTRISGRTAVPETERLESLAAHKTSMAIYLSITYVTDIQKILIKEYGKDFKCAIAYKVSQPEERFIVVPLHQLAETVKRECIKSQSLIIVSQSLNINNESDIHPSKLYEKTFTHGFRD